MKKRRKLPQKSLALLLALCAMLSMSACTGGTTGPEATEVPETVYVSCSETYYPFPAGYTVSDAARLGDRVFLLGDRGDGYALAVAGYTTVDGGLVKLLKAQPVKTARQAEEDEVRAVDLCAGGDGRLYLLTMSDPELKYRDYAILRYDAQGTFTDKISLHAWAGEDIRALQILPGGEFVLLGSDSATILSGEGELLHSVRLPEPFWISGLCEIVTWRLFPR